MIKSVFVYQRIAVGPGVKYLFSIRLRAEIERNRLGYLLRHSPEADGNHGDIIGVRLQGPHLRDPRLGQR